MAKIAFTAGRVSASSCPADKKQAFLWDATAPGLGLRATPNGKAFLCIPRREQGQGRAQVRQLQNPVIAAYLQCLLLAGARRDELAGLRWDDINFRWKGMSLGGKVDGTPHIPLAMRSDKTDSSFTRKPESVIHHSDKGSQYISTVFGKRCQDMGVRLSMGSVGDAYDNAMAESFFASLECELINRRTWRTPTEARHAVFAWIEGWYNPHGLHSALSDLSQ